MASSSGSGGTSGSPWPPTSSFGTSEVDERKQRRMQSNRESARRSRMRKQKHLEDLTAQAAALRRENDRMLAEHREVTRQYLTVEAENAVLRTQVAELSHRLAALNEIFSFMSGGGGLLCEAPPAAMGSFFMPTCSSLPVNNLIMASADMLQY